MRGTGRIITVVLSVAVCGAQTFITTIAGSGSAFPSTALPAVNAPLGTVTAVATDGPGNIYVADSSNNQIFRIDPQGQLTVFAGNGVAGWSGDGGPATRAALSAPQSLAFDLNNNLYVSDTGNFRIRKITPQGIITTFAGSGLKGFSGDGGPAVSAKFGTSTRLAVDGSSNVYVSDADNHRVRRITSDGAIDTVVGTGTAGSSGDGGNALQASLRTPQGLAFDKAGQLYIADPPSFNVRRIAIGGTISTVAGTGSLGENGDGGQAAKARLNSPWGVAVDSNFILYIADSASSRIRRVNSSGIIATVAGLSQIGLAGDGGLASAASLFTPVDLAVSPTGALLVADEHNFRVRSISSPTSTSAVLSTVAGNGNFRYSGDGGAATGATLPAPAGVVVDDAGNVTICDNSANRVRTVNAYGIINLIAGSTAPGFGGDGGPAASASFADCDGIARDSGGNLYIADTGNQRIRKISASGIVTTVAGNGVNSFSGDGGQATAAGLSAPQGMVVDAQGNLYIADTGNNRIRKVTPGGIISTIAGDGAQGYFGDGVPANQTQLNGPTRLAIDGSGNLYFSDSGNNVVRRISTSGTIDTVAGNTVAHFSGDGGAATAASLSNPRGLAFDSTGALLIADGGNNRIRRVDSTGIITTIAGNGSSTLSGDGRPPLRTGFAFPADVAVDPSGIIYVVDRLNSRVRAIEPVPASLVVSQTGLTFSTAIDAAAQATRTIRILNGGAGTIGWSAIASTTSGGSRWLNLSPAQGTATSSTPSLLTVTVNPAGLEAGNYYGQIQIVSPGVTNSPRFVTVVLNVLLPAQTTGASVSPAGVVFTGTAGSASPAAQNITVAKLHGAAVTFTSSISFDQSVQWLWLTASASTDSVALGNPATITLTPNIAGLGAGAYTGTLKLAFSDGSARNVPVALTLGPAGASGSSLRPRATTVCTATKLVPVVTALGQSFAVPAGWPVAIEATVVDDCGHNVSGGSVTALFSNGDPPLALASLAGGNWAGTWEPRGTASNLSITVTAQTSAPAISGSATISGLVSANAQAPPSIGAGGIVNQASYSGQNGLSPGAMVSIFGTALATKTALASSLPLPTALGGAQVLIGGIPVPLLYASPLQIDAIVPFELAVGIGQVIVQSGTALSVPQAAAVAAAGPGAFTLDGSGTGAATVYAVNPDGTQYLVTPTSPAHPGQAVVLYCTGLGGVQIAIDAGSAPPDSPLAPTNETVTITLGGVQAQILYAGLTPELVGLYQVDAVVPQGVTGDSVPLVLTSSGIAGTTVSLSIH